MARLVVPGEPLAGSSPLPRGQAVVADDRLSADAARRPLDAMNRRIPPPPPDDYARYRAWRARRAQRLSLLYVPLDPGQIPLRVAVARRSRQDTLRVRARRRALRELPGDVGAAERRHRDIAVAARGSTGTTASSRRSARSAPGLAAAVRPPAFDLGTGIAVLTHRGVVRLVRRRIVAWANENLAGSATAPAPRS